MSLVSLCVPTRYDTVRYDALAVFPSAIPFALQSVPGTHTRTRTLLYSPIRFLVPCFCVPHSSLCCLSIIPSRVPPCFYPPCSIVADSHPPSRHLSLPFALLFPFSTSSYGIARCACPRCAHHHLRTRRRRCRLPFCFFFFPFCAFDIARRHSHSIKFPFAIRHSPLSLLALTMIDSPLFAF